MTTSRFFLGSLCVAALLEGCATNGDHDGDSEHPPAGEERAAAAAQDAGEAWSNEPSPLIWTASWVAEAPTLDGSLEGAWEQATPVTVKVREAMGGDHPIPVVLRALYTDDAFYLAAEWPDDTKSDLKKPYIWNAETGAYEKSNRSDDQFCLQLPISGDFAISMLTTQRAYHADAWHWKAGRGNAVGYADDKSHHISQTELKRGTKYELHGGRAVWIWRPGDAGKSPYGNRPAPTEHAGDEVSSIEERVPEGSRGDVRAKASYTGTGWTLEMGRVFNTGHDDDAVIVPAKDIQCSIAIMDQEGDEEHSVSTMITLRFAPKGK